MSPRSLDSIIAMFCSECLSSIGTGLRMNVSICATISWKSDSKIADHRLIQIHIVKGEKIRTICFFIELILLKVKDLP